jgi:hypothetical protein
MNKMFMHSPLEHFKCNIWNLMTQGHWKEISLSGRIYTLELSGASLASVEILLTCIDCDHGISKSPSISE